MTDIASKAKELLSDGINVIIGYQSGTAGNIRPAIVTDPAKAGSLIFNEKCRQNLAVYLTKHEVKHLGKAAIFATLPVMRSVIVLISEHQVKPENVVVIGIDNDGSLLHFNDIPSMQAYIEKCDLRNPESDQKLLEQLNAMSKEQRFDFWSGELSKCIKCYACRQSCPMCYCTRCSTDYNQPQWIPVQSNIHGNMDWHILRALHLAGRCISCGECSRACPVGIPCHLLTMQLVDKTVSYFNVYAGTSSDMKSVMSTYEPTDKENFII
ncbi:MAG: 4Fe-4S dicluster domain-containing protein [Chloroflexota bacterium]